PREDADRVAVGRARRLEGLAARGVDPLAADVVLEGLRARGGHAAILRTGSALGPEEPVHQLLLPGAPFLAEQLEPIPEPERAQEPREPHGRTRRDSAVPGAAGDEEADARATQEACLAADEERRVVLRERGRRRSAEGAVAERREVAAPRLDAPEPSRVAQ